jgi:Arc/MetJ-type ribon-helix-helix transcriptional regulator
MISGSLMAVKTSVLLNDQTYERAMKLVQSGTLPHLSALVERALNALLEAEDVQKARSLHLRGELIARAEAEFLDADLFQVETGQMFSQLLSNPWTV